MKAAKNSAQIRIIGGQWRGRKLPVISAEGLRPTTDRVRETVFNWLQFDLADAAVLDLFAGTGALGFEALSRGASRVDLVETDRAALLQLKENRQLLAQTETTCGIHSEGAERFLTRISEQLDDGQQQGFDVVFIDPPFNQNWLSKIIPLLSKPGLIKPGGFIYVETERREYFDQWPQDWSLWRDKTAGRVHFRLFTLHT